MLKLSTEQMNRLRESAKQRESSSRYGVVNKRGFTGAYQFGLPALEDLGYIKKGTFARLTAENKSANSGLTDPANWTGKDGMKNVQAFKANKEIQDVAFERRINTSIKDLTQRGVLNDSSTLEEIAGSALAAHLIGAKGLATKGLEGKDANGTKAKEYYGIAGEAINGLSYNDSVKRKEGTKQSPPGPVYNTLEDRIAAAPFPGLRPADVNAGNTFDVNEGTRNNAPFPGLQPPRPAYRDERPSPNPGMQPPKPAPPLRDYRPSPNPGTQRVYGNAPVPGLQRAEPSIFGTDFLPPIEFTSPTTGLIDSYGNPVLDGQGEPVRTRF